MTVTVDPIWRQMSHYYGRPITVILTAGGQSSWYSNFVHPCRTRLNDLGVCVHNIWTWPAKIFGSPRLKYLDVKDQTFWPFASEMLSIWPYTARIFWNSASIQWRTKYQNATMLSPPEGRRISFSIYRNSSGQRLLSVWHQSCPYNSIFYLRLTSFNWIWAFLLLKR